MTSHRSFIARPLVAAAICAASTATLALPAAYSVEIRRTDFGVPHIKAGDYGSLAYGLGYAYAQDNACLLFDQVLTVRGERSRFLGAQGTTTVSFHPVANVDSDFFFALTMDDEALRRAYAQASAQARASVAGYVAGVNRFLRDTPRASLPVECRDAAWVRPLSEGDVYRLLEEKATQAGSGAFAQALATAHPPETGTDPVKTSARTIDLDALNAELQVARPPIGSNGWAFGGELGAQGRGVLLGNPHFPWATSNRFYQSHLTIPGQLDVMGVSLGQFPVINIGFNHDVAWTHTVSTARRFTLYALQLEPGHPTRYVVDGHVAEMTARTVSVPTLQADGSLAQVSRTFYSSSFGPVLSLPQAGLPWNSTHAYAIADANLDNARLLDTWLAFERARSIDDVKVGLGNLGIPWVNTLATDRAGHALYADVSAVPAVDARQMVDCAASPQAAALFARAGLLVLDGARAACAWRRDEASAVPGLLPARDLPLLERRDFVANSNDSYWLANPNDAAHEYAPIIGPRGVEQSLRTRMSLTEIERLASCRAQAAGCALTAEGLRDVLFADRNLAAQLVLGDFLGAAKAGEDADLKAGLDALAAWDRSDQVASRGAVLFHEWWLRVRTLKQLYRVPFDPADPVHTPRGLNVADPAVLQAGSAALSETVRALRAKGFAPDVPVGQVQAVATPAGRIGIPGGDEREGVLNKIDVGALAPDGYHPYSGSSYIQAVGFSKDGPHALGLLVYGQSSDPKSPYHYDQMALFANSQLPALPFTEAEVAAHARSVLHLDQ